MRVDSHTWTTGRMERLDTAGRGLKISSGILGVHPALDHVTPQCRQLEYRKRCSGCDADLLLYQIDPGDHLRHRVLHLDARVHLHEVELPIGVQ